MLHSNLHNLCIKSMLVAASNVIVRCQFFRFLQLFFCSFVLLDSRLRICSSCSPFTLAVEAHAPKSHLTNFRNRTFNVFRTKLEFSHKFIFLKRIYLYARVLLSFYRIVHFSPRPSRTFSLPLFVFLSLFLSFSIYHNSCEFHLFVFIRNHTTYLYISFCSDGFAHICHKTYHSISIIFFFFFQKPIRKNQIPKRDHNGW